MSDRKVCVRFFTVADYEDEEIWLREQHRDGWRLLRTYVPCFFVFERCAPEDVAYRLDFKPRRAGRDYFQLFEDYGWEYLNHCMGWLYFRRPSSAADAAEEGEIFSDAASRIDVVDRILKTRMLPLFIVFLCCLLPNFFMSLQDDYPAADFFAVLFALLVLLYLYLFIHCGRKLRRLRQKYRR